MSTKKISDIIGVKVSEIPTSSTNFWLLDFMLARREKLSLEVLFNRIDPNDPDEYVFSNPLPLSAFGYKNAEYYEQLAQDEAEALAAEQALIEDAVVADEVASDVVTDSSTSTE